MQNIVKAEKVCESWVKAEKQMFDEQFMGQMLFVGILGVTFYKF